MSKRKCPKCGSKMKSLTSHSGNPFFGCSNYPNCRHAEGVYERVDETVAEAVISYMSNIDFVGIERRILDSVYQPQQNNETENREELPIIPIVAVYFGFIIVSVVVFFYLSTFKIVQTVYPEGTKTYTIDLRSEDVTD